MDYETFLNTKTDYGADDGFAPLYMPDFLFDFQTALTDWAVRKGRGAIFADCGLGKTLMELVWCQNVVQHTNKPTLLLTPLSVSGQTLREAEKFGIEAHRAHAGKHPSNAIHVTNYEQLHKFNAQDYAGVVCDESSILKNFDGVYKSEITEFMRVVPYRLLATATPSPNDWDELGTSSEALGYLGYLDMVKAFLENNEHSSSNRRRGRWELNDADDMRDKFRLRGHAVEGFWKWVASWARAARKPSDLGYPDDGFNLPELIENFHEIKPLTVKEGLLFDVTAINFQEQREVIRRTIPERCEAASEAIAQHDIAAAWCNLNPEGEMLAKLIPDSWEISGRSSDEEKEEAVEWFVNGKDTRRVLISKPKILGFGLNFQHCNYATWFPTFSYEQYYQGTRRFWRFGQARDVTIDNFYPEGGERMMQAIVKKTRAAEEMFSQMIRYMHQAEGIEKKSYNQIKLEVPSWLSK
jgi:hypothetical protein